MAKISKRVMAKVMPTIVKSPNKTQGGDIGKAHLGQHIPTRIQDLNVTGKPFEDSVVTWDVSLNKFYYAKRGEVNTASNIGTGIGIYDSKVGVDLRFRSLLAGDGILIEHVNDDVQISSTLDIQKDGTSIVKPASIINFIGGVDVTDVAGVATINIWDTFLDLTDTPSTYAGEAGKLAAVNDTEDGIIFIDNLGGGVRPIVERFENVDKNILLGAVPADDKGLYIYTASGTLVFEGTDYTIIGSSIVFNTTQGGETMYAKYYVAGTGIRSKTDIDNNVNNSMTLSFVPMDDDRLNVYTDGGIRMFKGIDYTITGNIITFTSDQEGEKRIAKYDYIHGGKTLYETEEFNGVTNSITLAYDPTYNAGVDVYTDSGNMLFEGEDYTISGQDITFVQDQGGDVRIVVYLRY